MFLLVVERSGPSTTSRGRSRPSLAARPTVPCLTGCAKGRP